MKKFVHIKQSGFSLIEMVVSLAVFTVVIVISVGALLSLIGANEQLQAEQSVMTNLSFALDSMTREIRSGSNYYCRSAVNFSGVDNIFNPDNDLDEILLDNNDVQETYNCANGISNGHKLQGIAFVEGGESITGVSNSRILYYFDKNNEGLYRRVGDSDAQLITSSNIVIEKAEFFVTGSKPLSATGTLREDQAMVTIFIQAYDKNDTSGNPKKYQIQTTVTQRSLDI